MSNTMKALKGEAAREADTRHLRNALGQFATGVTVLTARAPDGEDLGMTISSFNTVSLRPPLVLFCIDRRALSLDAWLNAEWYGVSVLSEGHDWLANQFARPLADKWANVRFRRAEEGAPLILGAAAHFECRAHDRFEGGDHIIFLVEICRYQVHSLPRPLVFCQGRYNNLRAGAKAPPDWPLPIHY